MVNDYFCIVCYAGADAQGNVYISLSERKVDPPAEPAFVNRMFYANDPAKREMLAVALACLTSRKIACANLESTEQGSRISAFTITDGDL